MNERSSYNFHELIREKCTSHHDAFVSCLRTCWPTLIRFLVTKPLQFGQPVHSSFISLSLESNEFRASIQDFWTFYLRLSCTNALRGPDPV